MTLRDLDIKIDLDVKMAGLVQANAKIDAFINKMKYVDDQINIKIDVDAVDAMAELHRLEAQLQRIERHTIDVDVDSAAAMAQLAALQAQLALLNGQRINPNIGGIGGGGLFSGGLASVAKVGGLAATFISLVPTAIGVLGTAGYAVGALTNGVVALGSAIGSAGLGMGAFGLVAFTTISKLYDENAKLTQSQKDLKKHIDSLSYSYGVMEKSAQPLVYDTIGKGVNTIKTAIHMMTPIVDDAAIAIGDLFHDLNRSLQGERMTEFFDYIERSTGPMINNIGTGLGYALQGVANTMVALEPLTDWMGRGFENMFKRFADWSAIQKDSDGFADFIENTKSALSSIGDIAGDAVSGVKDFFGAFDTTATEGLDWLSEKMEGFSDWASDLDENQDFQDMLEKIKTDGPVVVGIIGNLAEEVGDLYTSIDNLLRDEEGNNGLLGWFKEIQEQPKMELWGEASAPPWLKWLDDMNIGTKIIDGLGVAEDYIRNFIEGIGSGISGAFSHIGGYIEEVSASISSVFSGIGEKISGWFSGLDIGGSVSASFGSINWADFIPSFTWPSIESLDWKSVIPSFSWPSIPTLSWSNFINRFNWPSLPSFSWQSFIDRFKWPSLPSFSWSGFIDKFKWPTLPKFSWPKVSVSDLIGKVGRLGANIAERFNTGIGNVPYDMPAVIHKGEAVIERDKAQELRSAGVLQGDGRYPKVDLSIPRTNSTSSVVTRNSNSVIANSPVFNINITSKDGDATEIAHLVTERVTQIFEDINITVPMIREG